MKTIIIKEYKQGLASFLDQENIKWEHLGEGIADWIKIYYHNDEDLFNIILEKQLIGVEREFNRML